VGFGQRGDDTTLGQESGFRHGMPDRSWLLTRTRARASAAQAANRGATCGDQVANRRAHSPDLSDFQKFLKQVSVQEK
jgi:hypothetical protein